MNNHYSHKVSEYLEQHDMARVKKYVVATELGVSVCTLERRLAEEGTQYMKLSDAERKRRLDSADLTGDITLTEIAKITGYACRTPARLFLARAYGMNIEQYREWRLIDE